MNPSANACPLPKSAVWCLAVDLVSRNFRPFGPLYHRNHHFPALRSCNRSFNSLHHKSKLLAFKPRQPPNLQETPPAIFLALRAGELYSPPMNLACQTPSPCGPKVQSERHSSARFPPVAQRGNRLLCQHRRGIRRRTPRSETIPSLVKISVRQRRISPLNGK